MTTILLVIAAIIAGVLIYAATRPGSFRISRTANILASPAAIFPLVNNLADHGRWSPFARDPKINNNVSDPAAGTGARVDFNGSCAGSLTITDSAPFSRIEMRLVMTRPMKADNLVEFAFVPYGGNSTDVTWTMSGPQPYLGKLMSVFVNCDRMVGRQFEQGLAELKKLAEGQNTLRAAE